MTKIEKHPEAKKRPLTTTSTKHKPPNKLQPQTHPQAKREKLTLNSY